MFSARKLSVWRLRAFLAVLFAALAAPMLVLVVQAQRQMDWESFHQHRSLAQALAAQIDAELQRGIAIEEARSFSDYGFVVVGAKPGGDQAYLQRSELSQLPIRAALPGVIGYFQVDGEGQFSTPLFPSAAAAPQDAGLDPEEWLVRRQLHDQLLDVLSRNRLAAGQHADNTRLAEGHLEEARANDAYAKDKLNDAKHSGDKVAVEKPAAASELGQRVELAAAMQEKSSGILPGIDADRQELDDYSVPGQSAFDQLNAPEPAAARSKSSLLGRVDELSLGKSYQDEAQRRGELLAENEPIDRLRNASARAPRKEQNVGFESKKREAAQGSGADGRVRMFESEVDPLEFGLLESGHAVLFRRVFHDGRRVIQGLLLDEVAFLQGAVLSAHAARPLAATTDLVIAYKGDVLRAARAVGDSGSLASTAQLRGELLHQSRLAAPLGGLELLWSVQRLPAGPGARIVGWSSSVLIAVLLLAIFASYRVGLRQIALARQQQDFVSAVSHELKTPLTSIRMYAEMLSAGWANEDRKREYYAFILDESERLSRLIANVLQLARLERNELELQSKPLPISVLLDLARSKLNSQIERAGFAVAYQIDPDLAQRELSVDADAFLQIVINLVDNALKFAARAERREIEIAASRDGPNLVLFTVRDFGPGIPPSQLNAVFGLFYRVGNELTREATGTGIGLALVRQLARAMRGEIEACNRNPGAELRLRLPLLDASPIG